MKILIRTLLLTALLLAGLLLVANASAESTQKAGALELPTEGVVFSSSSLRVGINNLGSFGFLSSGNAIGWQMPPQNSCESLAVGWWGEGYLVAYKVLGNDNIRYFYPSDGNQGFTLLVAKQVGGSGFVSVVATSDSPLPILEIAHAFSFDSQNSAVTLLVTIRNRSMVIPVTDVYYKRVIDWDVCMPAIGTFTNNWSFDSANLAAIASAFVSSIGKTVTTTVRSGQASVIDLYAWDDRYSRGVGSSYWTGTGISCDCNAGLHFDLGTLLPQQIKILTIRYSSSMA